MKGLKRLFIFIALFSFIANSSAQIGGTGSYKFLDLPPSARVAALGGHFITIKDDDLGMAYQNPALLNKRMENAVTVNAVTLPAGIKYGYFSHARNINKIGLLNFGLQYVNYGSFEETTETGQLTGETFNASDLALTIGYSKKYLKKFSYGGNVKVLNSSYEQYNSWVLVADIGGSYSDSASGFSAASVIKNVGFPLNTFRGGSVEFPIADFQASVSQKLKYAPFRFSLTYRHIEQFDIIFIDPNERAEIDFATGEEIDNSPSLTDKIGQHLVLGSEILFSENFHIRVGYNHQRRTELQVSEKAGATGFSFGFGMKVKRFNINYANARYHLAGASNHFSIAFNLKDFS
ncbi:MAG: hypothetical protein ACJAZ3_000323 [Sphingobacteriales bacterium]|jgi:hypothetical protein